MWYHTVCNVQLVDHSRKRHSYLRYENNKKRGKCPLQNSNRNSIKQRNKTHGRTHSSRTVTNWLSRSKVLCGFSHEITSAVKERSVLIVSTEFLNVYLWWCQWTFLRMWLFVVNEMLAALFDNRRARSNRHEPWQKSWINWTFSRRLAGSFIRPSEKGLSREENKKYKQVKYRTFRKHRFGFRGTETHSRLPSPTTRSSSYFSVIIRVLTVQLNWYVEYENHK